ncbi:MAG TPA: dephospho-CoA kinase [Thermoanaerobaculia bacterium]|nr:dephospho-CoA kinase [Thermoanaerobaculia bacterium]
MILRVGLTGGIASGKSTISTMLAGLGCMTIDADEMVVRLYRPGGAGHEAIVREYGRRVLTPTGEVDRQKLADIAFATPEAAAKLNGLIHPLVIEEEGRIMAAEAQRFPDRDRIYVVEATLLLESGGRGRYDKIVVVDVEPEIQLQRAIGRGLPREETERRMRHQMDREERLRQADYVIDNSGDRRAAENETMRVYEKLREDLREKKEASGLGAPGPGKSPEA